MTMRSLEDSFLEEMHELRNAETQLAAGIPAMAKRASDSALQQLLHSCQQDCDTHVKRIDLAFTAIGKPSRSKTCNAMTGMVRDAAVVEWLEVTDHHNRAVDALLLAAVKKIVQYEIAAYETLCTWAKILEMLEAEGLLRQNLAELQTTQYKLNQTATTVYEAALVGRVVED